MAFWTDGMWGPDTIILSRALGWAWRGGKDQLDSRYTGLPGSESEACLVVWAKCPGRMGIAACVECAQQAAVGRDRGRRLCGDPPDLRSLMAARVGPSLRERLAREAKLPSHTIMWPTLGVPTLASAPSSRLPKAVSRYNDPSAHLVHRTRVQTLVPPGLVGLYYTKGLCLDTRRLLDCGQCLSPTTWPGFPACMLEQELRLVLACPAADPGTLC
jgi:hypothetical protein